MSSDSIVTGPRRRTDGRKFDTWEVMFPGRDQGFGSRITEVEVFVKRTDESYKFFLDISKEKKHPFNCHLEARTPDELKNMLDAVTQDHVEKTWTKKLRVNFDSWQNARTSPEDPGDHSLKVEWYVVMCKKVDGYFLYMHDGEFTVRDTRFGHDKEVFLPWTQQREDVLRSLGNAIHTAHQRLEKLLKEDKLADALDNAVNGNHFLTEGDKTPKTSKEDPLS